MDFNRYIKFHSASHGLSSSCNAAISIFLNISYPTLDTVTRSAGDDALPQVRGDAVRVHRGRARRRRAAAVRRAQAGEGNINIIYNNKLNNIIVQ